MRFIPLSLALVVLLSAMPARADAVDDQYARGAAHYNQQRWREAGDEFGKLLAANPDHPRAKAARFYYGESLAQLDHWQEARAQFAELIRRDPADRNARPALFRSGEAAYLAGDRTAAKRDLEAFRQQYPQDDLNGYVLAYLASMSLQSDGAAAAAGLFAATLEQFPNGPLADECHLGLAQSQEQLGQLEQARAGYQQLADAEGPWADQARLDLGMLENSAGNPNQALVALESLAAKQPDGPLADKCRLSRGYAFYKLDRYDEAEPLLLAVAENPALRVEARYWLGLSQAGRKDWHAAAQTLIEAAQLDDKHRLSPAIGFHAAQAMAADGQAGAATAEFDRVLARWPESAWADDCLFGKLRLAVASKSYTDSVRLADQLAAKYPDSPLVSQAKLVKGESLLALGKSTDAVESLASLAKQPPSSGETPAGATSIEARSALALAYAKANRLADAGELAQVLLADNTLDARRDEACYQVAELAYAAGNATLAQALYAAILEQKRSPDVTRRALFGLGWCHFSASSWSEASADFDRLLTEFADSSSAPEAALMRGQALEHVDQADAALAMYRVVIDRYSKSDQVGEALWRVARLHDALHQREQAIELYARLVEDQHEFTQRDAAMYRWAWLLRESGQDEAADKLFEQLRRDFPGSRFAADATLRLAERALAEKNFDYARGLVAVLLETKSLDAVRPHALYLKARIEAAAGQWSAVVEPLDELIKAFPAGELALPAAYLLAEAAYQQGHYEQAAAQLAVLAEHSKDHPESWSAMAELRRGQALAQMKQWKEALEIATGIATRFPNFEQQYEADYLTGRALAAEAEFDAARAAYAKVLSSPQAQKTQAAALAQWMIGESYFHQENYAAALTEYAKVDAQNRLPRWQSAALLQAGKCHEMLGQWQEAAEVYDRLLTTYPTSEFNEEATRRLATARRQAAAVKPAPK